MAANNGTPCPLTVATVIHVWMPHPPTHLPPGFYICKVPHCTRHSATFSHFVGNTFRLNFTDLLATKRMSCLDLQFNISLLPFTIAALKPQHDSLTTKHTIFHSMHFLICQCEISDLPRNAVWAFALLLGCHTS
jgi:hypothetical protein